MIDNELRMAHHNLAIVKKALVNLDTVTTVASNFIRSSQIRDIYRGLRGHKVRATSTQVMVHTENIIAELHALERTLRDAEAILLQQAEHYGKDAKTSR